MLVARCCFCPALQRHDPSLVLLSPVEVLSDFRAAHASQRTRICFLFAFSDQADACALAEDKQSLRSLAVGRAPTLGARARQRCARNKGGAEVRPCRATSSSPSVRFRGSCARTHASSLVRHLSRRRRRSRQGAPRQTRTRHRRKRRSSTQTKRKTKQQARSA